MEQVRKRQRLTQDYDSDNQQLVEHEHNNAEGINVIGRSFDPQDTDLDSVYNMNTTRA